jgi:hypothetical protein
MNSIGDVNDLICAALHVLINILKIFNSYVVELAATAISKHIWGATETNQCSINLSVGMRQVGNDMIN